MLRALMLLSLLMPLHAVQAQIQLPRVQTPRLPVDLPVDVDRTVGDVTQRLDSNRLVDLRRLQIGNLLREHRKVVDRDPNGEPVVRSEVTAFSPTDAALERARAAGFTIAREKNLEGLDAKIVVLQAPAGTSTRRALLQLRKLDPEGTYDFNHIYTASGTGVRIASDAGSVGHGGEPEAPLLAEYRPQQLVLPDVSSRRLAGGRGASLQAFAASAQSSGASSQAGAGSSGSQAAPTTARVGLIDGGVDASHAVFRGAVIHQYGCGGKAVPSTHGTAVASLLAGRSAKFHGALPGSQLYAADVYCASPTGGAVDAVAEAFAWMARERVPTINVSLVGPSNATLQNVVRLVISRGFIVVAAVGNDGPAAPPLFPAAYPDVVGVTGVDSRLRVLIEAARGKQVDFAAPGGDMAAADLAQSYAAVRGTSFAAPLVAGLLAATMVSPDKAAAERAIAQLRQQAVDLGSQGLDSTYGNGLVGNSLRMEPALAKVREE